MTDETETGCPDEPNYAELSETQMLAALGDDAAKWAAAFSQIAVTLGYSEMDRGWLIGWFANAIEHSSNVRHWRSRRKSD